MDTAGPARCYVCVVANRGAARRSDHTDSSRKDRNRTLQFGREQSFGLQSRSGLFERQLQRPRANRFEAVDDKLILALRFVHTHPAARPHLQTIFGPKPNPLIAAAITRRAQLRKFVLKSKVPVGGEMRAKY